MTFPQPQKTQIYNHLDSKELTPKHRCIHLKEEQQSQENLRESGEFRFNTTTISSWVHMI